MTFPDTARWIWDDTDPATVERHHLRARRSFTVDPSLLERIRHGRGAVLRITAETCYQAWINGTCLGHGPAKSPEGERFIDTHDLSLPGLLRAGENTLEILVHALGTGTMSSIHAPAGLLFAVTLPDGKVVPSDAETLVRADPQRRHRTARRWIFPCVEDIDAGSDEAPWTPARVIEKQVRLLPRPVALPSRRPFFPDRVVAFDTVRLPGFSVSFRLKPSLVDERERRRCNMYRSPALVVTDLISPCAQTLELVPASGEITWYFNGRKLVAGSGWARWNSTNPDNASAASSTEDTLAVPLAAGANRLVGVHSGRNHFEEVHLAGFVPEPITAKNPFGAGGFQVIPVADATLLPPPSSDELPDEAAALVAAGPHPAMDPADTLPDANPQDRVVNARVLPSGENVPENPAPPPAGAGGVLLLQPAPEAVATRLILDLGSVQNGRLAFTAFGAKGGALTFSFFESLQPGPPLRILWPGACNNVLRYRLREGWQTFESLLAHGVRYIAIHHEGARTVELRDLRIVSAYCGNFSAAVVRTGDVALDAIHALCEQTLVAATDDTLTDCPTYEAVNWNFDNRLGALADLVTFRNLPLLRNTIEHYTRDPLYPGLVRSHTPSAWDNRIPVFSFHWILFCRDYHEHTADLDFAARVFPQVARGLDEALAMIDPATGLLRWRDAHDSWHIVDWAKGRDDRHDIVSAEQALLLGALEAGEYLAACLGNDVGKLSTPAGRWRAAGAALRAAIDRHLWQPARDAYADSLHADGSPSPVSSQASNAALALYRVGSPEWRSRLHRRLQTSDPALLPFGSPMGLFYILEFLDRRDDVETIFKLIRDKWTPMLLTGDKTAWEHFPEFSGQPDLPTRSRCHPFATYILKYYAKYLFGLGPTGPGRREFLLAPRPPADLDSFEGALPVSDGWIRVSWRRSADNRLDVAAEAPPGIRLLSPSPALPAS